MGRMPLLHEIMTPPNGISRWSRLRLRPGLAMLLLALLAACSPPPPPTPQELLPAKKFRIIAMTTQLAELAREIGGEAVIVECPVTAQAGSSPAASEESLTESQPKKKLKPSKLDKPAWNANPFTWVPTAGDLFSLQTAHMVLLNGLGVEKYLDKEIDNLRQHDVLVISVGEAVPEKELIMQTGEENKAHPLIHNSPRLWKYAVTAVTEGLKQLVSPEAAPYFEGRANPVLDRMDRLMEWSKQRLDVLRSQNRTFFISSHDSLAYFCRDFGMDGRAFVKADGSPLAFDKAELEEWLTRHDVNQFLPDIAASKDFVMETLKDNKLEWADPICSIYLNRPGTLRLGLLETYDTGTYDGAFRAMVRVLERKSGKSLR